MTNTYRLRLNGCGEQRTKEIDLELSAADARRLAEWDLGYLMLRRSDALHRTGQDWGHLRHRHPARGQRWLTRTPVTGSCACT